MNISNTDLMMPNFTEEDFESKSQQRKILQYLHELNDKISYMFRNIDSQNLTPELSKQISAATSSNKELEATVSSQRESLISIKNASEKQCEALAHEIINSATDAKEEFSRKLEESEEGIRSIVSRDFVTKNDFDSYTAETISSLEQLSSGVNILVSKYENVVKDDSNSTLCQYLEKLQTSYSFTANGIVIGQSSSPFKMYIRKDMIAISCGDDENGEPIVIAYFSANGLEISSVERVRFGNMRFIPESDGSISFAVSN